MQVIVSPHLSQSAEFLQKALEDKYTQQWFITLAQFHHHAALDSAPQYTESFTEFVNMTKTMAAHMLSHNVVTSVLQFKYGYVLPEHAGTSTGYSTMANMIVDKFLVGQDGQNYLMNHIILLNRALGGHFARLLAVFVVGAVIDITWRQAPLPPWFKKFVQVNYLLQSLEQTADQIIQQTLGTQSRMYERIMTSAFRRHSTSNRPNMMMVGSTGLVPSLPIPTFPSIVVGPQPPVYQFADESEDEDRPRRKRKSKRRKHRRKAKSSSK